MNYVNNFEDMLHNMMGYTKYVINTNGTRLLKDKGEYRYNLYMRVSIDGSLEVRETGYRL